MKHTTGARVESAQMALRSRPQGTALLSPSAEARSNLADADKEQSDFIVESLQEFFGLICVMCLSRGVIPYLSGRIKFNKTFFWGGKEPDTDD